MLKIKDNVDLKVLESFGFVEYNTEYVRRYENDIATDISKETREITDIDFDYKFLENEILGESKRVQDLVRAGLVERGN